MNKKATFSLLALSVLFLTHCRNQPEVRVTSETFYETELFKAVQMNRLFEDSKTFVDLERDQSFKDLERLYLKKRDGLGFDLEEFVEDHFTDPTQEKPAYQTDTTENMYEHISSMWGVLGRGPDTQNPNSSRIPLPHPYIVPGGRFKEIYYWDSFFTMIGLMEDNQMETARNMVANFGHLVDSLGFIPNGTRDYYLTRSQPPYFALMVALLAEEDSSAQKRYFSQIEKEYRYWMKGMDGVTSGKAINRVVEISKDLYMNRYWDRENTPRPESYSEDILLAKNLPVEDEKKDLYSNLRAAASSGWDFSSRWYAREGEFASTQTSHLLPVDLNSLIYFMEIILARGYNESGNTQAAEKITTRATARKKMINTLMWDPLTGFYKDYNFASNSMGGEITLAGVYPLYFKLASNNQAGKVRDRIMEDFLKPGGLVTTLRVTGQQWDAPNGWAPLQWMTVKGLLNYGYRDEAREIMERWLALNERVYRKEGKMMEKYNVVDTTLRTGGGEYPNQDGFGWTNGVALGFRALLSELPE